jgi:hypothetical protein
MAKSEKSTLVIPKPTIGHSPEALIFITLKILCEDTFMPCLLHKYVD